VRGNHIPFKSKKQFQYLRINEPEVFKKYRSEDKRDFKDLPEKEIREEESELGLISKKNLDELLNDETLHSYFSDPDNFDKYFQDIQEFFSSENALTLNQLSQYLENLGYGPKTIELSLEILSKSDEERAKEKEVAKKGIKESIEFKYTDKNNDTKIEKFSSEEEYKNWLQTNKDKIGNVISYRPINEVLGPLTSDYKREQLTPKVTSPDKSFADMLKNEISNIKEEMTKTKNAEKLIELNKKLDKLIKEAFELEEDFTPAYEDLLSVANELADEYKISHPNYIKDIEKFWYENIDNNENFLPQYSSDKRKQIYWNSIASIIEDYQDYSATDVRQMGRN
jgi:flagellar hook-basal body complex protein FliE